MSVAQIRIESEANKKP